MSRTTSNLRIFIVYILFSILIFALDSFNLLSLPKQAVAYITNPVSFGFYQISREVGKQFYFMFEARFAAQENKALKVTVGQLLSENANIRKKLAEVESLVSQEKHLDPSTYNLIAARPIGLGRYLKIDKGSKSGIVLHQAVVFNENLIGRIVQVSERSANIQLLTDPDSKVAAFSIGREGRSKGVLLGQFGTETLMDKILHEEKIATGDLVYSEGTEGNLPRGLILGSVSEVLERENEVFKQAKIKSLFDIRDLELVFVIQE